MIGWCLAPGVDIRPDDGGAADTVQLRAAVGRSMAIRTAAPGVAAALLSLAEGPRGDADVAEYAGGCGEALDAQLAALLHQGILQWCCTDGRSELLRGGVTSVLARLERARPAPGDRLALSRFATMHRVDGAMVIESPAAHTRLSIGAPPVAALLAALAEPRPVADLCAQGPLPAPLALDVLELLAATGIVGWADADGNLPEDTDPDRAVREYHDVLLHWYSRKNLAGRPVGATYPFRDRVPPPPATKPVPGTPAPLPRPDLDVLRAADRPYAQVAEDRRSVRAFATTPLRLDQVGEFLYRTARIRADRPADAHSPYDRTDRPVPSGGATHDLELYLTVTRCDGLAPGVYHYEPREHGLSLVTGAREAVLDVVRDVQRSIGTTSVPQAVVTLAARFGRMSWKYRGLGYAVTLQNAGVLYEAMYLTATAMGLGGCAAGTGDSALFARITGLDPLAESSVGEFVLGIPADRQEEATP